MESAAGSALPHLPAQPSEAGPRGALRQVRALGLPGPQRAPVTKVRSLRFGILRKCRVVAVTKARSCLRQVVEVADGSARASQLRMELAVSTSTFEIELENGHERISAEPGAAPPLGATPNHAVQSLAELTRV